jgi:hypothetical protein
MAKYNKGETKQLFAAAVVNVADAEPTTVEVDLSQSTGAMSLYLVADGPCSLTLKCSNGKQPFVTPSDGSGNSLGAVASLAAAGTLAIPVSVPAFEDYEFTLSTSSSDDVEVSCWLWIDNKE